MGVFASQTTTTIPVPHDPPQTVTIRKLRGREVEDAQAGNMRDFLSNRIRWQTTVQAMMKKAGGVDGDDLQVALHDPLIGYDRYIVIKAALLGWTYTDHTPTADEIDDLDDETIDFIARAILRLTKPHLFADPELVQKETAAPVPRVNGSGAAAL